MSLQKSCKNNVKTIFLLVHHLGREYNKNKKPIALNEEEDKIVSDITNEFGFDDETKGFVIKLISRVYDREHIIRGGSKSMVPYDKDNQSTTKTLFTRFNLSVLVMFICAMIVMVSVMIQFRNLFESIDQSTQDEPFLVFMIMFYKKLFNQHELFANIITTAGKHYATTLHSRISETCMNTDSVSNTILTSVMSLISPSDVTSCMIRESNSIITQQLTSLDIKLKTLITPLIWSVRIIVFNGLYLSGLIASKAYGSINDTRRNSRRLTGGNKSKNKKNRKTRKNRK